MGRLPLVSLGLLLCAALGCENQERKATFTTRERSQAVEASSTATAAQPSAAAEAPVKAAKTPEKPRRSLCGGRLEEGRSLPKKRVSKVSASNGKELPAQLAAAKAGFTWINFWAAWCAPCKEEIPRLLGWERQLASGKKVKFDVAFVSIDDDERQLRAFLDGSSDLRSTYWLREGTERDEWMSAAGLEQDPELPIHLLVDSEGKIRCRVQGAVEDSDFSDLVRLLVAGG
jgi:thiol-disulfide isomerase/thioredoxin